MAKASKKLLIAASGDAGSGAVAARISLTCRCQRHIAADRCDGCRPSSDRCGGREAPTVWKSEPRPHPILARLYPSYLDVPDGPKSNLNRIKGPLIYMA